MFKKLLAAICCFSLLFCVAACGNDEPQKESKPKENKPVSSVVEDKPSQSTTSQSGNTMKNNPELWKTKMVCLTFDDGPQDSNGELLDILKEKGVKATFFLRGDNMEKYPELVKRMIAEGHDVGWHSYSHQINSSTKIETVRADFSKAQQILNDIGITDYKIKYLRCPGGNLSDNIKTVATEMDWRIINWTNYGFDDHPENPITPQERADKTFATTAPRNGEVVLIHPRTSDIAKAVGIMIDSLKAQDIKVVSVSEILQRKNGGTAGELYGQGSVIY